MLTWKRLKICLYTIPGILLLAFADPAAKNIAKPDPAFFAGSTPCDAWIRNRLRITDSASCEFMKWEMKLFPAEHDSGTFELKINYGISQPNTNGFKGGGKTSLVRGTYYLRSGAPSNAAASYLLLSAEAFPANLYFVKISPV